MPTFPLIEYEDAPPEVRAVYDDIMTTRQIDWINNFWKAIAHDPQLLKRTWESLKEIMGPGAIDPLTKELLYIAVSVTNNCQYCIASHTASAFAKGMAPANVQGIASRHRHGQRNQQTGHRLPSGNRRALQAAPPSSAQKIISPCNRPPFVQVARLSARPVFLRGTRVLWLLRPRQEQAI